MKKIGLYGYMVLEFCLVLLLIQNDANEWLMCEYKYDHICKTLGCTCPEETVKSTGPVLAYRYTSEDVNDKNNWLPVAMLPSSRPAPTSCKDVCGQYGLSFYLIKEKAEEEYRKLVRRFPSIRDRLGEYIAYGYLCECDGDSGTVNSKSHFNLYEYEQANFTNRFKVEKIQFA